VVQEAVRLLEPVGKRRDVRIEFQPSEQPLRAIVDGEQMQQVLTNVMLNAMQAMPEGGRIDVGVRPCVDGPDGRPCVRIEIRDTGDGIRPEHLERVFDPFFTTKGSDGTGLGLSIASEIVRDHGGSIRIESEVGSGTCVSILLPEETAPCVVAS
jgi:signal transduction histidine kinase